MKAKKDREKKWKNVFISGWDLNAVLLKSCTSTGEAHKCLYKSTLQQNSEELPHLLSLERDRLRRLDLRLRLLLTLLPEDEDEEEEEEDEEDERRRCFLFLLLHLSSSLSDERRPMLAGSQRPLEPQSGSKLNLERRPGCYQNKPFIHTVVAVFINPAHLTTEGFRVPN